MKILVLCIACILDYLLGDPPFPVHPVVWIGRLTRWLEDRIRPVCERGQQHLACRLIAGGIVNTVLVCLISGFVPWAVLAVLYRLLPPVGVILEIWWCARLLAARSLQKESMAVCRELREGTLAGARQALSRIVGRDTAHLDESETARAAVETVAENTSDGVIAPMLYYVIGGLPLMFVYKAINTMDSMQGYRNERYFYYGKAAARTDDAANLIPSRLSGLLMVASSFILKLDGPGAWRIFIRDRYAHPSPNSAQTEAAAAGALGVRLGGPSTYFGILVQKPYIGDPGRPVTAEDIPLMNRLMYMCAVLGLLVSLLLIVI